MMNKILYEFNAKERQAANAVLDDPDGWKSQQAIANHKVREDIGRMAFAVECALKHPDDPDSKRLMAALCAAFTAIQG